MLRKKPEVKFLVLPGKVKSENDGDIHYVGVRQLAALYHLPDGSWRELKAHDLRTDTRLPILKPLYRGNYDEVARSLGVLVAEEA